MDIFLHDDSQLRLSSKVRRRVHAFIAAGLIGGALIAAPQVAKAAVTPQTPSGASGAVSYSNNPGEEGVDVEPQSDFSATSVSITGTGEIIYNAQDAGNTVTAGLNADALSVTNFGDYASPATPGSIDITTVADIAAGNAAIVANNGGTGGISITTTGANLYGDTDNLGTGLAINALNSNTASTGDITITTGNAYAQGGNGLTTTGIASVIAAANYGSGDIIIDTTAGEVKSIQYTNGLGGDYTAAGDGNASGISALIGNVASSGDIDITTGDVSGATYGIYARNTGHGDITVTNNGAVNSSLSDAIHVEAPTWGAGNGDYAGNVTINANGDVHSQNGYGISVYNEHTASDNPADADATYTKITTNGQVTSDNSDAIHVWNANDLQGQNDIIIDTSGGATSAGTVSSATDVTGATYGIYARGDGRGDSDISITTGNVTSTGAGAATGIYAENWHSLGTGDVDITTYGKVLAENGGWYGIQAINAGSGSIDVQAYDSVHAYGGNAIDVTQNGQSATGGTITIHARGDVIGDNAQFPGTPWNDGAGFGIRAVNNNASVANGTKSIDIIADGEVVGNYGVFAQGLSGEISIVTNDTVTGGTNGIYANNINGAAGQGGQAVNITANGDVTASTGEGIYAETNYGQINVIANGNVTGGNYGIHTVSDTGTNNLTDAATVTVGDGTNPITVQGNSAGIYQWGFTDLITNISDGATVQNSDGKSTSNAIIYDGWPDHQNHLTIDAGGTLIGNVASGNQGQDIIDNHGTWNNAGGVSVADLGTNSQFNNYGDYLAGGQAGAVDTYLNFADQVNDMGGDIVLQNADTRIGGAQPAVGDRVFFNQSTFTTGGGNLLVDTDVLNGLSDELHVKNVVTGQIGGVAAPTTVQMNILDNGGLGKSTDPYHNGDGILVVGVTGTSNPNAFQLDVNGKSNVSKGLYTYELEQGLTDTQSWFLRSEKRQETQGLGGALAALGGGSGAGEIINSDGTSSGDSSGGAGAAAATGPIYAILGNLRDRRRGETLFNGDTAATKGSADGASNADSNNLRPAKDVWARVIGASDKITTDGAGSDTNTWGAQAGIDLMARGNVNASHDYAGLYAAYANTNGHSLDGSQNVGKLGYDTTALGAYYTRFINNIWYIDIVGQYAHLNNIKLGNAKNSGNSFALSAEAGRRFGSTSGNLSQELQAQLIWQHTSLDDINLPNDDGTTTKVSTSSGNPITGRIGIRIARNAHSETDFVPWLKLNLWHTANGHSEIRTEDSTIRTPFGGNSAEIGLGFSKNIGQNGGWGLYGNISYMVDLSSKADQKSILGSIGIRKGF